MRPTVLAAVLSLAAAGAAQALELRIQVRDASGRPAADAVAMVHVPGAAPGSIRFPWPMVMSQHDLAFEPHLLIAPVGAEVTFPNRDTVRHHVYSFSPAKRFELKLYGHEESRSVRFDKPGPVALGCNIHDSMAGFIYVVDTPYAAKTGADGVAVLKDLPAGAATLTVWHPAMKGRGNKLDRTIKLAGDQTLAVTADIAGS